MATGLLRESERDLVLHHKVGEPLGKFTQTLVDPAVKPDIRKLFRRRRQHEFVGIQGVDLGGVGDNASLGLIPRKRNGGFRLGPLAGMESG